MALLTVNDLNSGYGDFQALFGVNMRLEEAETIAIIGANGAGKSTLMRSISGIIVNEPEAIRFDGKPIGALPADEVAKAGIAMVPEGRRLFPSLSVEENLKVGAFGRSGSYWSLERIYELFPVLKERRHVPSTSLSGGQQQMVAIGRALMSNPRLLSCDEISLGLAPVVINDIYNAIPVIKQSGASLVLVEQDISRALKVADRIYCMMEGRVTLEGTPDTLRREDIHAAYFGVPA